MPCYNDEKAITRNYLDWSRVCVCRDAEDLSVWIGSPPCQPFSQAGQRKGQDDDCHLAPSFLRLVATCRPELVFGEGNVTGKLALQVVVGPTSAERAPDAACPRAKPGAAFAGRHAGSSKSVCMTDTI